MVNVARHHVDISYTVKHIAAVAALTVAAIAPASATVITGPELTTADFGWVSTGLSSTANDNSILASFLFTSQKQLDTVVLATLDGTILQSVTTTGGAISVNWALLAGQTYLLLQTVDNNAYYASNNGKQVTANAEITITDTGLFGCSAAAYANCSFKGQAYWAAFTNIKTVGAAAVPEPGSLALLGLALAGMATVRRRKAG